MKIYDDDPEVYGHTTDIKPDRTKSDIDGILARYGVKDVFWRYDLKNNDVYVKFILPKEKFQDSEKDIPVMLNPPVIWHQSKGKAESINWSVSMRNLYWYILTHLSQAYVMQSGRFTEFLPHILNRDGKKLIEIFRDQYQALPESVEMER